MRAGLCISDDGDPRHPYISLSVTIMRSKNDLRLPWPFNYRIIFCLYDQSGAQNHIIDSFQPDKKSNSFQRPNSEMNIASGIPKFYPLSTLQQEDNPYVKDECIFIKILIDFCPIPDDQLPYLFSLNPGIPTRLQMEMIQQQQQQQQQ